MARLISETQDQDPEAADLVRMRLHFVMCKECRDVNEQMGFLRRAMQQLAREVPPGSAS